MTADESRRIGLPLMIGLIVLPLIFVWFLLRPGYANSTRVAAFAYALLGPLMTFAIAIGEAAGL